MARLSKNKKQDIKIPGIPEDFGAVLAALEGRKPTNDDMIQIADDKVADLLPFSTRIARQAARNGGNGSSSVGSLVGAFNQAVDPRTLSIGQLIEGKGVYVGTWEPTDNNGRTLGKVFDLYAAPEDIRKGNGDNLLMTFNKAVKHVAGLQNWHGHNGGNFENEKAVIQAVRNNPDALRNWFIPTREILHGQNTNGDKVQRDNLYDHRGKMPRGSEFVTKSGSGFARWYWSCTEGRVVSSRVYVVAFSVGLGDWVYTGNLELSTRPVRAELRP